MLHLHVQESTKATFQLNQIGLSNHYRNFFQRMTYGNNNNKA